MELRRLQNGQSTRIDAWDPATDCRGFGMPAYARLDRPNGLAVDCGRPGCGEVIARVVTIDPEFKHMLPSMAGKRLLAFPPGWVLRDGGVWQLGTHAEERRKRGLAPRKRRRRATNILGAPDYTYFDDTMSLPTELPVEAMCPHCRTKNVLDAARLDVEPRIAPVGVANTRFVTTSSSFRPHSPLGVALDRAQSDVLNR